VVHPGAGVTLGLALLFMVGFVYADTGSADSGEAVIWAVITAVSAAWLVTVFRGMHAPDAPWLRPRVWP
jgi:VIT1/CCC1 family predicted Fe2+/Mn2+ transporter